jgi:DNA-binding NarL/FixJ family response regulator
MPRILVADDHEIVRRGIRALLEARMGYEVVAEAGDGAAAVQAAIETRPDVAVLDYSMPLLNGLEATRRIRQGSPNTEVLMFTVHDRENIIRDVLNAGARGYLLKSDVDVQLVDGIRALSKHRPYFSWRVSEALLEEFLERHHHHIGGSEGLTPREREVVQLIAEGMSNKQISRHLQISVKTVEAHRTAAMRKLGLSSTANLVRYAVRNDMVQP